MISALFRILLLNTKCTQIGSLLYLNQLKHQTRSNKSKVHKMQGRHMGDKRINFLAKNKTLRIQANVYMINNIYLIIYYQLSKDKRCKEIIPDGSL